MRWIVVAENARIRLAVRTCGEYSEATYQICGEHYTAGLTRARSAEQAIGAAYGYARRWLEEHEG